MIKELFCRQKIHNAITKRRKARFYLTQSKRLKDENDKLMDFYQSSERFRGYVDRCAANYSISVQKVLSQTITREVARYYMYEEHGAAMNSVYMPMGECV